MMHLSDMNLAGLAVIAFLALFFPSSGMIHRRARRIAITRQQRTEALRLQELIIAEASRLVSDAAADQQPQKERESTRCGA